MLTQLLYSTNMLKLAEKEQVILLEILPRIFGYYSLLAGINQAKLPLLTSATNVRKNIIIYPPCTKSDEMVHEYSTITCALSTLPFLPESIDLILLSHLLEQYQDQNTILNEAYNTLINGGHLILIGFNHSWLHKIFNRSNPKRHSTNAKKIIRILIQQGFEIEEQHKIIPTLTNNSSLTAKIGAFFASLYLSSYIIVAKKSKMVLPKMKINYGQTAIESLPKPTSKVIS